MRRSRYSLQRTMIIYFLLIGFASMLVVIEFLAEFQSGDLKEALWQNIRGADSVDLQPEKVFAPIDRLRSKALLMIGIIMFVMIIVLTMFIKNITEPLQHMIRLSQEISAGDLSRTVRIQANNELAELGNVINEMSSNLQEIILLSQRTCESGQRFVDRALDGLAQGPPGPTETEHLKEAVLELKDELATLKEVIAYFSFYTVEKKGDAG